MGGLILFRIIFIDNPRITLTAVDQYYKVFVPFPLLHSKLIHKTSKLLCPITSDISAQSVNLAVSSKNHLVFGDSRMAMILETPKQEAQIAAIKKKQYHLSRDEVVCHEMAKWLIEKKIAGRKELLESLSDPDINIQNFMNIQFDPEFTPNHWRNIMFNIEGMVSNEYWQLFDSICRKYGWEFESRSRRPAVNEINALLNYGYAILLGKIHNIVLAFGLDPYVGFLHTLRSGRASLCLDLIEPFRYLVDQAVLYLIFYESIKPEEFEKTENGINLKDSAKTKVTGLLQEILFLRTPGIQEIYNVIIEIHNKIQAYQIP